jgi:nucleoside-diphosphate-sugar epimerase
MTIRNEDELISKLTEPSTSVREAVTQIQGNIMLLGVAGKMGPTLAELLVRAGAKHVIGVSRFSDSSQRHYLDSVGLETIQCDLMDDGALLKLPEVEHLILLAGQKFGGTGNEPMTWAVNTLIPARILQRYPRSKMVYVSSGNVYQFCKVSSGGSRETDALGPIGEYAESRLGGERLIQYYSSRNGTPVTILRLFYATELRYGIILDIARKVRAGDPVDLSMGYVNQVWQGDANSYLARSFCLCESPAKIVNLTGPEILSVRHIAQQLGRLMGTEPVFQGRESETALLGNASVLFDRFGPPSIKPSQIIEWVADWVMHERPTLNRPTKYETRTGKF